MGKVVCKKSKEELHHQVETQVQMLDNLTQDLRKLLPEIDNVDPQQRWQLTSVVLDAFDQNNFSLIDELVKLSHAVAKKPTKPIAGPWLLMWRQFVLDCQAAFVSLEPIMV